MSAQAPGTHDLPISDWQGTPVIIKTGGDLDPANAAAPITLSCIINMGDNFRSNLLNAQWQSAKSAQIARILGLEIKDGNTVLSTIKADSPGLAVLQVSYGEETLMFQEMAMPNSELTKISISSSVPFRVTTGGQRPDEWTESTGEVPAEKPFVLFTQGEKRDQIQCTSTNVEITVQLDWGEM